MSYQSASLSSAAPSGEGPSKPDPPASLFPDGVSDELTPTPKISDLEESVSASQETSLSGEIRDDESTLSDPIPDDVLEGTVTANETFTVSWCLSNSFVMATH